MAGDTSKPITPEFLTAERQGTLTVLKCRTTGEALLVAEQLEAADILVVLPGEEDLEKEFESSGSVSIRVSSQSYEAAKELQTVIERKHWDERAKQSPSIPIILLAVVLGLLPIPGILFLVLINDSYKKKKYPRKAKLFCVWFLVGFILLHIFILKMSGIFH